MQSKISTLNTKKSGSRLSKNEKNLPSDQVIVSQKALDRQKMIATAAYYRAEKRGFKSAAIDAEKDWLEAEMEIDNELDVFDVNSEDFQFLRNKIE